MPQPKAGETPPPLSVSIKSTRQNKSTLRSCFYFETRPYARARLAAAGLDRGDFAGACPRTLGRAVEQSGTTSLQSRIIHVKGHSPLTIPSLQKKILFQQSEAGETPPPWQTCNLKNRVRERRTNFPARSYSICRIMSNTAPLFPYPSGFHYKRTTFPESLDSYALFMTLWT